MADDDKREEGREDESQQDMPFPSDDFQTEEPATGSDEDSGLGNLPPLSDFESSTSSESGDDPGGLPPLSEIEVETPQPSGGRVPPGNQGEIRKGDSGDFDTPSDPHGDATSARANQQGDSGSGFQDLAADSDFSPETPDIGPGPDSDIDTPMFDSAFGGADSGFDTPQPDTGAPTQAMETPMFGEPSPAGRSQSSGADDFGFDSDAFGAPSGAPTESMGGQGGGDFGASTPAPDFGFDSGQAAPPPPPGPDAGEPAPKKGGPSIIVTIAAAVIALLAGMVVNQFLGGVIPLVPNPVASELSNAEQQIATLNDTIQRLREPVDIGGAQVEGASPEDIERLVNRRDKLRSEIEDLTSRSESARTETTALEETLDELNAQLDQQTEEYARAQEEFDQLQDQVAIVRARQEGLVAEVDRLTGLVGELDVADQRRMATRDTLMHATRQLAVEIQEGIPLTPPEYSRQERIAAVNDLLDRIERSDWVSPDLLDDYNDLQLRELAIAESREYFFAKIPVVDRFGAETLMWAECLMNGNWSVYFRSLDGRHIGIYENTATGPTPDYAFVQFLPGAVEKAVEKSIIDARVPGFEEQVKVLAEKQKLLTPQNEFQQVFDSL